MERQELIRKIEELPQDWLAEVEEFVEAITRRKEASDQRTIHQALADYAIKHAGTATDLDAELEAASVEHLLQETSQK